MTTNEISKLKPQIYHGKVNGKFFVVSVFSDEHIIHPMMLGLQKFFTYWDEHQIQILEKEKIKKETDRGYFSLSSSSKLGGKR